MPYIETDWTNLVPPPISGDNLDKMEAGIYHSLAHSGGIRNTAEFLDETPGSTTGGLDEAIADLGGSPGVVFVAPHNHPIDINNAIPSTIHLMVSRGATFTIANGVTLTINGTLEAGLYQIFSCVGTGAIVFSAGSSPFVRPEWWYSGAGSWASAITAADVAFNTVRFARQSYGIESLVTQSASRRWEGIGRHGTVIDLTGAAAGVAFGNYGEIAHLCISGDNTANQVGLRNVEGAGHWVLDQLRIQSCDVGLELSRTWIGSIIKPEIRYNAVGAKFSDRYYNAAGNAQNNIQFFGGSIHTNTDTGVLFDNAGGTNKDIKFYGTNIEGNTNYGLRLLNGTLTSFGWYGGWLESNMIGAEFGQFTYGVLFDEMIVTLADDVNSKGIVTSGIGDHDCFKVSGTRFMRAGTVATVAIEFNNTTDWPILERNRYDTDLVIVDNTAWGILLEQDVSGAPKTRLTRVSSLGGMGSKVGINFTGRITFDAADVFKDVVFGTNEPDTDYGVYIAPTTWATGQVTITAKAVGGFRINFANARGAGTENVYWLLIRR